MNFCMIKLGHFPRLQIHCRRFRNTGKSGALIFETSRLVEWYASCSNEYAKKRLYAPVATSRRE
jgi:hypothetical protein